MEGHGVPWGDAESLGGAAAIPGDFQVAGASEISEKEVRWGAGKTLAEVADVVRADAD